MNTQLKHPDCKISKSVMRVRIINGRDVSYQVVDDAGVVIATRNVRATSNRKYVACTANGEYFFGRMDLVGKGDHGRAINELKLLVQLDGGPDRERNKRWLENITSIAICEQTA